MSGIELLLSDSRGVFIPRDFCACFVGWTNIDPKDAETCVAGPDQEWYWEAWDKILCDAFYEDQNGKRWTLHQDGDLFVVCEELMTDEEYENFYGNPRDY